MALKPGGFIPVVHAATKDRPDEIDTLISAEAVAAALAELGFVTEVVAVELDLNHFYALKRRDPLLVFNLVDAVRGDGRLAPVIPSLLDAVGLPYTGGHSDAWLETLSKVATKLKLEQAGLPTPGFSVDGAGLDPDARFIVKAVWEHGSLGLDESSVVKGADVASVIADRGARFGTEHFAERYIDGREFNLALLEERGRARVLPMAEILFENWDEGTPRIVGYDAKWTLRQRGLCRHAAPLRTGDRRARACGATREARQVLLGPVQPRRLRQGRLPRRCRRQANDPRG